LQLCIQIKTVKTIKKGESAHRAYSGGTSSKKEKKRRISFYKDFMKPLKAHLGWFAFMIYVRG
jgi:hypothetical protein